MQKFNFHNAVNNDMTYLYALYVKQKNLSSNIGGVYENGKANWGICPFNSYNIPRGVSFLYGKGGGVMSYKDRLKSLDYRHYICAVIAVLFLLLTAFVYRPAVMRCIEAFRDFGLSIGYYFSVCFKIKSEIVPTVTQYSAVKYPICEDFEQFKILFVQFWKLFADGANFAAYLKQFATIVVFGFSFLLIIVAAVIAVCYLARDTFFRENNNYNHDTVLLKCHKRASEKVYSPVHAWFRGFYVFLQENGLWWKFWLAIWLVNLNAIQIAVAAIGYVFYFCVSFDLPNTLFQLYKLVLDLSLLFGGLPLPIWIIIGIILFDLWRKHIADGCLNHYENYDRGFISSLPIVVMDCGEMNTKKTTMLTDMALSCRVMFRDKALEMLIDNDLKFPNFPWINFENALKRAMRQNAVYNLASCEAFVRRHKRLFEYRRAIDRINRRHSERAIIHDEWCFGYDFNNNPMEYDNRLEIERIFDVLETYAKAYFIYICENYNLSNYSQRFDDVIQSIGNFPVVDSDFFHRDSRRQQACSRFAKILDFDVLRLGKKVVENNAKNGSFEFGIVSITEIGKERLNSLELQGVKKANDETNQKNDLFNSWLKMSRHPGTVGHFPFVKVFTDEQRPESWGADARDLCKIINVVDAGEVECALPFFQLEDAFCDWLLNKFTGLYIKYRFSRGDNCLSMFLIKNFTSALYCYRMKRYNRYGYAKLTLETQSGRLEGKADTQKYYLCSKKIYSRRFSTDCYSEFFHEKALQSGIGLKKYEEYVGVRATSDELKKQNSYFVGSLFGDEGDDNAI